MKASSFIGRACLVGIAFCAVVGSYAATVEARPYRGSTETISTIVAPVVWTIIIGLVVNAWSAPSKLRVVAIATFIACPILLALGGLSGLVSGLDVPAGYGYEVPAWAFNLYVIAACFAAALGAMLAVVYKRHMASVEPGDS